MGLQKTVFPLYNSLELRNANPLGHQDQTNKGVPWVVCVDLLVSVRLLESVGGRAHYKLQNYRGKMP